MPDGVCQLKGLIGGVCPHSLHTDRIGDRWATPLSSRKPSQAFRRRPFFYLRPASAPPAQNRQGHSFQGPQICGKAPSCRALKEGLSEGLAPVSIRARPAIGSTRSPQSVLARTGPNVLPAAGALPTDIERTDNSGRGITLLREVGGPYPTAFEDHNVRPKPNGHIHDSRVLEFPGKNSLYYENIIWSSSSFDIVAIDFPCVRRRLDTTLGNRLNNSRTNFTEGPWRRI